MHALQRTFHMDIFCLLHVHLKEMWVRFVQYCMSRVDLLRRFGVVPILVFDGDRLPMKSEEEALRSRLNLKPIPPSCYLDA